ncbi:Vomeronasal type-1 receptor 90 [Sciurus carolinensis]|uniref:Vomeronasal type-1 receptor n=1 Tax=Sciurus carolinensis TaxID=30640 RepID=A0AA41N019_SCICA|nr:Vomeronasal type-1 receptor 90 [Sciurus carolinensis]
MKQKRRKQKRKKKKKETGKEKEEREEEEQEEGEEEDEKKKRRGGRKSPKCGCLTNNLGTKHKLKPTDLIIGVLALIHLGMLIILGCTGLMALSSGYMVVLLCRHNRYFQHLQRTSLSPKASHVQRATWAILLLMNFFVLMYCSDCIFSSSRIV